MTGEEPPGLAAFCGQGPWFLCGMFVQPGALQESQDRLNLGSSRYSQKVVTLKGDGMGAEPSGSFHPPLWYDPFPCNP